MTPPRCAVSGAGVGSRRLGRVEAHAGEQQLRHSTRGLVEPVVGEEALGVPDVALAVSDRCDDVVGEDVCGSSFGISRSRSRRRTTALVLGVPRSIWSHISVSTGPAAATVTPMPASGDLRPHRGGVVGETGLGAGVRPEAGEAGRAGQRRRVDEMSTTPLEHAGQRPCASAPSAPPSSGARRGAPPPERSWRPTPRTPARRCSPARRSGRAPPPRRRRTTRWPPRRRGRRETRPRRSRRPRLPAAGCHELRRPHGRPRRRSAGQAPRRCPVSRR